MVKIVFDTLIVGVGEKIEIEGQLVYGTKFDDERYNQYSQRTADGSLRVYDTGVNVVMGELLIKNVTYEDGEILRTWLHEKAIFQLNNFTITILDCNDNPALADIGNGKGIPVVGANCTKKTDKGILKFVPPGNYKIKFPFTYIRS